MIWWSRRVSVLLGGSGVSNWASAGGGGSSGRGVTSTPILGSASSSSMIIVGSLGVALGRGGVAEGRFSDPRRQIQHQSRTRGPAFGENARSLIPVIGERYSSHIGRSRVCERGRDSEVSRARAPPFGEDSSASPSVRSMTSSVGVDAAGDTDFGGPALRLGCRLFSSSSEEITYTAQDRFFRRARYGLRSHEPTSTD